MGKRTYEHPGFEYDQVEVVTTIPLTANHFENLGWETISVIPPAGMNKSFSLLVKRVKPNPYDPIKNVDEFEKWQEWDTTYGGPWTHRKRTTDG